MQPKHSGELTTPFFLYINEVRDSSCLHKSGSVRSVFVSLYLYRTHAASGVQAARIGTEVSAPEILIEEGERPPGPKAPTMVVRDIFAKTFIVMTSAGFIIIGDKKKHHHVGHIATP